jgi:hypothetical protein
MALAGSLAWERDIWQSGEAEGGSGEASGFEADAMDPEESIGGDLETSAPPWGRESIRSGNVRRVEPRVPRSQREGGRPATSPFRPLGFNCPACGVSLVVREPEVYDGSAAPCPHCDVHILPPRIVYSAATFELHPLTGLSFSPGSMTRAPRAVPRLERRGNRTWRT